MKVKYMWTHLITLIVGFAAGCKIKDLLGDTNVRDFFGKFRNGQPHNYSHNSPRVNQIPIVEQTPRSSTANTGFSLRSIQQVFNEYHVELLNANSFNVLLREIRNSCYKNILRTIVEKATSADKLVEILKSESTPTFSISIIPSNSVPFFEEEKIDDLIRQENISPQQVGSIDEKVKFLLTLSHSRGIEDFKNTLGAYFNEIMTQYENHEDITGLYEQIMKTINRRYEFMK